MQPSTAQSRSPTVPLSKRGLGVLFSQLIPSLTAAVVAAFRARLESCYCCAAAAAGEIIYLFCTECVHGTNARVQGEECVIRRRRLRRENLWVQLATAT